MLSRYNPIPRIRTFYHEVVTELKKCTWPARTELIESTVVVIISLAFISVFVAVVDWVSQWLIRLVTVA